MANKNYGFKDMRNPAELMLAPGRPLSRALVNLGSLKLNLGAKIAVPGSITSAAQLTGAIRKQFAGAIQLKNLTQSLSTTLTSTLADFDKNRQKFVNGALVQSDPLVASNSFFNFSSLKPGQAIPSSFNAMIRERREQLQAMSARMASAFNMSSFGGVSITENFNKKNYPLDTEVDMPSIPRLAQGGAAAMADDIIKDKIRFAVAGVQIGAGKPSIWSRLISAAAQKASPMLNPVVNQMFKDRKNQSTWSEPPTPFAAQFPYNKVQQTESGHVIELDDTPGAERVHIFHRSGSFVEFHPNGTVVYKNMRDGYLLTMADQYVKVAGNCHIAVDGNATVYAKGNIEAQSDGDINFQAKGDFNVHAQNVNLRAKRTFRGDGTQINLRYIVLPQQIIPVMGGLVPLVNVAAIKADFPGTNINSLLAALAKNPIDPRTLTTKLVLTPPKTMDVQESPLTNPAIYAMKSAKAKAYRARLFDTPEETGDFQLYSAHIDLQKTLGDVAKNTDPRELGGKLVTPAPVGSVNVEKPTVNYLNFDDFKGKFAYANNYSLGGTSFLLSDVVDLALHPDVVTPLKPGTIPPDTSDTDGTAGGGNGGNGGRDDRDENQRQ